MSCLQKTRKTIEKDIPFLDHALDELRKKGLTISFHSAMGLIRAQADVLQITVPPEFEGEFFALGTKFHLFDPAPLVE